MQHYGLTHPFLQLEKGADPVEANGANAPLKPTKITILTRIL